jgi:ABC-2 type transport system ATP-binding protein
VHVVLLLDAGGRFERLDSPAAEWCKMRRMPHGALEVRDLRKRFGAIEALRGVSFAVEPGEVFGYLGPNGAGKTTTLRVVLGLARASSGSATIFGRPAAMPRSRDDIGFLPGDLRLYGDMTAGATLDFFARFRPARPPRLRAMLLEALGLDGATLARRVKFLSHGTRQKVGLVAAMQHDPGLLLLDEPTNGLDPLVQHAFRALVAGFAARGRAVLFSSHVLSEVEAVCERVAILRAGELVALERMEWLRGQVARKLSVTFAGDPPPGLREIEGVASCELDGRRAVLRVRGDVNPVLRALAATRVEEVVFPEPELEDVFLAYYQPGRANG